MQSGTTTKPCLAGTRWRDTPRVVSFLGRQGQGNPFFKLLNAAPIAGVIRQDFRQAQTAAASGLHPSPEDNRLLGIVAGKGHQEHADMIGFRFLLAIERQAPDAVTKFFLSLDPLARMMGQGVRYFM